MIRGQSSYRIVVVFAVAIAVAAAGTGRAPVAAPRGNAFLREPVFVPGASEMLWKDDFDHAASDSALVSSYITLMASHMHFDSTGGLDGSGAVRIDWSPRGGCRDDSRALEHTIPVSREVVVQFSVRYTPRFAFDWRRGGRCVGNAKKLFFLWADSGSRFDFISENHVLGMGSDYDHPLFSQNIDAWHAVTPEALADGEWHRITIRVRQSSTAKARDGSIYGWIDGIQRWEYVNVASNASGGWTLFKMPTTFNQGSPVDQSEWLDGLSIWRP
jgi:hypothetical protein